MPDTRKHRGPHPEDKRIFAPKYHQTLKIAAYDLYWLLSRNYGQKSALKIVGDRYNLTSRQRLAIARCICSENERFARIQKQVNKESLQNQAVLIDGYNILTTIESALSGAFLFRACDTTIKDLASVHGTYRKIGETEPAIELIGKFLHNHCKVKKCTWLFDAPISNSGKLKQLTLKIAQKHNWNWDAQLVASPDFILSRTNEIVISSDSQILNKCSNWFNLSAELIPTYIPNAKIIDLNLE